jgi:AcrR family transcriptional regulator
MDGLTMSALAKRLKVGVMTLYSYFRGRDELLDAMGRRAALELYDEHVDITTGTWQDELRAHYHAIRESLKRHPALAELVFHRGEVLPSSDPENYGPILAHVRRHVGAMIQGGCRPESPSARFSACLCSLLPQRSAKTTTPATPASTATTSTV